MKLSEYLLPGQVALLSGSTKTEALAEMVEVLAGADGGIDRQELAQAVWRREGSMSTGLGHGLAIPHVQLRALKKAMMAVGISREGIEDYQSIDGLPVHILVLIAAPYGHHETYVRLLARVAEVLKKDRHRRAVVKAASAARAYAVLTGGRA